MGFKGNLAILTLGLVLAAPLTAQKVAESPGSLPGSLLIAWLKDNDAAHPAFVAVIDSDPASATYGELITTASAGVPLRDAHVVVSDTGLDDNARETIRSHGPQLVRGSVPLAADAHTRTRNSEQALARRRRVRVRVRMEIVVLVRPVRRSVRRAALVIGPLRRRDERAAARSDAVLVHDGDAGVEPDRLEAVRVALLAGLDVDRGRVRVEISAGNEPQRVGARREIRRRRTRVCSSGVQTSSRKPAASSSWAVTTPTAPTS